MNKALKLFVSSMMLLNACTAIADHDEISSSSLLNKTFGHNFFSHRSQGWMLEQDLIGVTQFIAPCDSDCLNGFLAITPEYSRNFNRDEIGEFFFYNGTNTMTWDGVTTLTGGLNDGSALAATAGVDVFAPNFFLNSNFNGQGTILPRFENFIVDLRFRLNLDEWICGLYFDAHAPINYTRWDLNLKDVNTLSTGTLIAPNTFGNPVAEPSPISSIVEAYNGQILNLALFPLLQQTLQYGRVNGAQSKTSLADITLALGYNFICNECSHLGVDIRGIFPTGTRPNAEFLFEPVVGNGKHFELGGGLNAHYEFWNNNCDSSFSFWFEGVAYHMFKANQRRIFDLKNTDSTQNIGSSRLLIKRFTGAPGSGATLAEILFGPNVLARQCKVGNDVHAELVALFDYQRCGFTLDFGYNFWVRTKDKISSIETIAPNTYGLAGNTGTGDFANFTGSTAKINGADGQADGATPADNIYIKTSDLSLNSVAHPTAMSHKVFAHISYAWDGCDYNPFLGIGGSVEFSGNRNNAFDMWAIWLKGGFAFF